MADPALWHMRGWTPIYLINGSTEPVYRLVVGVVMVQGTAPHTMEEQLERKRQSGANQETCRGEPCTTLSILPPGRWRVLIRGSHWAGVLAGRPGAEVAFTDRGGVHWVRRALGELDELPEAPFTYFGQLGLYGPLDFRVPEPVV
ncbi:MAG TPA: hypothetical protein VMV23_05155 [Candidatus Nanopelagicaceae bacterium]|nr:hypothetical protein [Candidatus Nanopelagicaceae bacterium]